jgi:uncharacterized protein
VIGGGTPLDGATAFAQWRAARRLVERRARTTMWHAATLGLMDRLRGYLTAASPDADEVNAALWGACDGGQRQAAEELLDHGAEVNWIPGWENLTPLDAAIHSDAAELADWLHGRSARTAAELYQQQ